MCVDRKREFPTTSHKQRRPDRMEKIEVHILIMSDNNKAYIQGFLKMNDAMNYVKKKIRTWKNSEQDKNELYDLQEEAEKALRTNGRWIGLDGLTYEYKIDLV